MRHVASVSSQMSSPQYRWAAAVIYFAPDRSSTQTPEMVSEVLELMSTPMLRIDSGCGQVRMALILSPEFSQSIILGL